MNDDTLDFTGDKIVTGNAQTYAGGKTTSQGTKKTEAKTGGAGGGGTGNDPQPAVQGPDRSRAVTLSGSTDWKCPWPGEADAEQMDEARVEIEVAVGPDGRPSKVTVLTDPGFGFAREAKSCALRQSYNAALDRDGKPIASSKKFKVRFER
jgi:protein TonB